MISTTIKEQVINMTLMPLIDPDELKETINYYCQMYPKKTLIIDVGALKQLNRQLFSILWDAYEYHNDLMIIETSPMVYSILEQTGMTEVVTVLKQFNTITVTQPHLIGEGANSQVYRLDHDRVVKVYRDTYALPALWRELELSRKAIELGIPTVLPYDIVHVNGHYGIVYELLNATSFSEILATQPHRLDELVRYSVKLLKQIHQLSVSNHQLPTCKERFARYIDDCADVLTKEDIHHLHLYLSHIPDSQHVIHGDFHTKNLMLNEDRTMVIDMDTLSCGDPLFEWSQMYIAFMGFAELDKTNTQHFLGYPYMTGVKYFDGVLKGYYGTQNQEFIDDKIEQARVLSYVRMIRRLIRHNQLKNDDEWVIYYREALHVVINENCNRLHE